MMSTQQGGAETSLTSTGMSSTLLLNSAMKSSACYFTVELVKADGNSSSFTSTCGVLGGISET